jgi:hypothetical protein
MTNNSSATPVTVNITGYVALNITNPDQSISWAVGRLALDSTCNTSDFFAVGDIHSTPPATIGTYTIQAGHSWAYHTKQLVWHEVDSVSYTAIKANNNIFNKTYTSATPSTTWANTSSGDGLVFDTLGASNIEVVVSRADRGNPPDITNLPWLGNLTSTYLNSDPVKAFGTTIAALPAYSNARSPINASVVWSLSSNHWVILDSDQVICEVDTDSNGHIVWRPTLVSALINMAMLSGIFIQNNYNISSTQSNTLSDTSNAQNYYYNTSSNGNSGSTDDPYILNNDGGNNGWIMWSIIGILCVIFIVGVGIVVWPFISNKLVVVTL